VGGVELICWIVTGISVIGLAYLTVLIVLNEIETNFKRDKVP
jgi:hypothetical protein